MIYIKARALADKLNAPDFQLVDVREHYELEICALNGLHIPMGEIVKNVQSIDSQEEVCVVCRTGKRAAAVADLLETDHGFTNVYVLEGGILAYANEVDQTLEVY